MKDNEEVKAAIAFVVIWMIFMAGAAYGILTDLHHIELILKGWK